MTNKLPVVGKRYRNNSSKAEYECVFVYYRSNQCVLNCQTSGLWIQYMATFFEHFEELLDSNSQETEEVQIRHCLACGVDYSGCHYCIKSNKTSNSVDFEKKLILKRNDSYVILLPRPPQPNTSNCKRNSSNPIA